MPITQRTTATPMPSAPRFLPVSPATLFQTRASLTDSSALLAEVAVLLPPDVAARIANRLRLNQAALQALPGRSGGAR